MSHYTWSDMNIAENGSHLDPKPVPEIIVPDGIDINVLSGAEITSAIITEVVEFINQYNTLPSGNISRLSKELLISFAQNDAGIVISRNTKQSIIGVLIGYITSLKTGELDYATQPLLPCSSSSSGPIASSSHTDDDENDLSGIFSLDEPLQPVQKCYYVNYLCVLPSYRRQSLAMMLIRRALMYARSHDILLGYYLTAKPHHREAFPIKAWFRPLDYVKSVKAGFVTTTTTHGRNLNRERILHELRSSAEYSVERIVTVDSLPLLHRELKSAEIAYYPDEATWFQNIKNMPFFHIYRRGEIIGFAMISNNTFQISSSGNIITISHLGFLKFISTTSFEQRLQALKALGIKAKSMGGVVLCGYNIGDMDEKLSSSFKCYQTVASRYLEIYNFSTPLHLDRCYPILF